MSRDKRLGSIAYLNALLEHSLLIGLGNDDHPQYVLYSGATEALDLGAWGLLAGQVKTNNYQNLAGDESLIWDAVSDWWEFSNDLYVTGYVNITDETNGYKIDSRRILSCFGTTEANENIFIGASGNFTMTGGQRCIFIGYQSGIADTTGDDNIGIGRDTLIVNTEGYSNIAIGSNSLNNNTIGYANTAIGDGSLDSNIDGYQNVAVGFDAMQDNTSGYFNTAVGFDALCNNTIGQANTGIGVYAGISNVSGNANVYFGLGAGQSNISGSYNVFIGYNAGYNQTVNDYLLIIDAGDRGSAANEITNSLIYGVFNTVPANQTLRFNAAVTIPYALGAGAITGTSFIIGANTLNGTEFGYLDGQDQALKTTDTPQFARLGIGTASVASRGINNAFTVSSTTAIGIYNQLVNTSNTLSGYMYGFQFGASWRPATGSAVSRSWNTMMGGYGAEDITLDAAETKNYTVVYAYGYRNQFLLTSATAAAGIAKFTNAYNFYAFNPSINANSIITTLYAFYDAGQTAGATNWGLGINTTNNYINGNLRVGGATAPTNFISVGTGKIDFFDNATYIWSSADGWLNLVADTGVEINAPVLNLTGTAFAAGGGFDCGDAGGFSGLKFNAGTTQLEVWIDGGKIGHFATDGAYTDDI